MTPFCAICSSSGASTVSVSVRVLFGSVQVVVLSVHPGVEVAVGVAVLAISVAVMVGPGVEPEGPVYVIEAAPAVLGSALIFAALHVSVSLVFVTVEIAQELTPKPCRLLPATPSAVHLYPPVTAAKPPLAL